MKQFSILFLSISFLFSCSKDSIDQTDAVIGVWEQESFSLDSGLRLVFAEDSSGLIIDRKVSEGGEVITSAVPYDWELNNDAVTVYLNGSDTDVHIYILNSNNELLSSDSELLPFIKISDTTLDYY